MRKRKLWLLPVSGSVAILPIAFSVSCGDGNKPNPDDPSQNPNSAAFKASQELFKNAIKDLTDKPETASKMPNNLAKDNKFRTFTTAEYSENAYREDVTSSYGAFQNRAEENTAALLIRRESFISPLVETRYGLGTVEYKIKRPSLWKYKLDLASKIIVTKLDGTEEIFDNDKVDLFPTYSNDKEKTFDKIQYQAFYKEDPSNQESMRSINGQHFFNVLKEAKRLRFEIRENLKWTDADGNLTKYNIKAEDYYISMLRKYFLTTLERKEELAKLGNPALTADILDKDIRELLPTTSGYFTSKSSYPNAYVFKLYGFDMNQMIDQSRFITEYNGKNVVTLDVDNPKSNNAGPGLMIENMATTYDFAAAPSEYIAEHADDPLFRAFQNAGKLNSFLDLIKKINPNNLISKAGIYWYGANSEFVLYAGPYIYSGYNTTTSNDGYKMNKNYWNQEWVNSDNSVKEYIRTYKNNKDKNAFVEGWFNDYKKGDASDLNYSDLSKPEKDEIANSPSKFNLSYSASLNTTSLNYELLWMLIPNETVAGEVFYNEHFAKLVYGSDNSTVTGGTIKGESAYTNLLAGNGLSFRTIIDAAINWSHIADFSSNGVNKTYIAGLAQNGPINGKDADPNKNNVLDFYNELNRLIALDKNQQKINFGDSDYISAKENIEYIGTQSADEEKFKSAKYKILQTKMTELLDKFYKDNNLSEASDKIEWTASFRWANWLPLNMKEVYKFVEKLVNGLDTKGRLKVTYDKFDKSTAGWYNRFYGNGPYSFSGWGYDYNSIGSGLDGISSSRGGLGVALVLIGTIPNLQNKLNPSFPKLVQAAKDFVQYIKDNTGTKGEKFQIGVPIEKWKDLDSKYVNIFRENLTDYEYDTTLNKLVPATKDYTDFALISAKFFFDYNAKKTNEELIELASEMTNYTGPNVGAVLQIPKDSFSKRLYNSNISVPYSGNNGYWFADTIIYK